MEQLTDTILAKNVHATSNHRIGKVVITYRALVVIVVVDFRILSLRASEIQISSPNARS